MLGRRYTHSQFCTIENCVRFECACIEPWNIRYYWREEKKWTVCKWLCAILLNSINCSVTFACSHKHTRRRRRNCIEQETSTEQMVVYSTWFHQLFIYFFLLFLSFFWFVILFLSPVRSSTVAEHNVEKPTPNSFQFYIYWVPQHMGHVSFSFYSIFLLEAFASFRISLHFIALDQMKRTTE